MLWTRSSLATLTMVGATENVLLVRSRVGGLSRASSGGGGLCWGVWLPLISIRAAARATAGAAITYKSCDVCSNQINTMVTTACVSMLQLLMI